MDPTIKNSKRYWIFSSNENKYRLKDYLNDLLKEGREPILDWHQVIVNNLNVGDIVFMYCSSPYCKINYMFEVLKTFISPQDRDMSDSDYWVDSGDKHYKRYCRLKLISSLPESNNSLSRLELKRRGFTSSLQGQLQLKPSDLLNYVLDIFNHPILPDFNAVDDLSDSGYFEGALKTIQVNTYERDREARADCIKYKGLKCAVCGMDFKSTYGDIGEGFIHVHHLVPMNTIGAEYRINPQTDLVPVCPNCHAMLHYGMGGEARSIEKLKEIFELHKNK